MYRVIRTASPTLSHSGILGMKWGVRRYQYDDGGLTPEGKLRYAELQHSYKGTQWKKHLYVYKKGDRYYYSNSEPTEPTEPTDDKFKFVDDEGNEDTLYERRFVEVQNIKQDVTDAYNKTKIAQVIQAIEKFMHTPIVDFFKKG